MPDKGMYNPDTDTYTPWDEVRKMQRVNQAGAYVDPAAPKPPSGVSPFAESVRPGDDKYVPQAPDPSPVNAAQRKQDEAENWLVPITDASGKEIALVPASQVERYRHIIDGAINKAVPQEQQK